MTARKTPGWEVELWSYVSSGDGAHCPLYGNCRIRQKGKWCPADYRERLDQVAARKRFDLSDYDFIERTARGGIFGMVEMLALRWLKEERVYSPPTPVELVSLADAQCPIEVRRVRLRASRAATWRLTDGWVIQLKGDDPLASQRFSLFHEAFHILAHCNSSRTPVFSRRGGTEAAFNEMLADYFAFCVLMPREWVKQRWPEVKDLDRMMAIFGVSRTAMAMRLKGLALF